MDWLKFETDAEAARGDLTAWAGGGLVWAAVTLLAVGQPVGMILGATLAVLLRRVLRSVVVF